VPLDLAARLGFGKWVTFLLLPLGFLKLLVQFEGFPTEGPIVEALGIDRAQRDSGSPVVSCVSRGRESVVQVKSDLQVLSLI
jgi:hypothetical protein